MQSDRPGRRRGTRHERHTHGNGHTHDDRGTAELEAITIDLPETFGEKVSRVTSLDEAKVLAGTPGGRVLVGAIALIALLTVIGLVALWPRGGDPAAGGAAGASTRTIPAEVTGVRDETCPGAERGDAGSAVREQRCRTISVDPEGELPPGDISIGPTEGSVALEPGDAIRVTDLEALQDAALADPAFGDDASADLAAGLPLDERYGFASVDRTGSLLVGAVLLALLAIVALRVRGLLALLGVALSLLLLVGFLVPAILAGHPPLLVALVGALAVMFVTLVLTNGVGAQTLAGALGISLTLLFTTIVGLIAVRYTGLDGSGSELSTVLAQAERGVSLEGVLLAGMVIGGLGVLADTAVTQASAVMALRRTDPLLGARSLYRHAVVVGRDHLSATIHTLVLAYAGTVLPLLLVLHAGGSPTADTINQVDIAEPILATIVGCAGLIVAVPLTTALAAMLVARIPPSALPDGGGHHH